ncbi:protein-tyrosine-phosphatase [Microbacterium phyllosphaerae]|nr:protein-tyrosine-phosphatase [Microbacterium phyllosphaerae]
MTDRTPRVLFVCQHNAGRSQLGAALLEHLAGDRFIAASAGLAPADTVNPAVAATVAELGIDIADRVPRAVTPDDLHTADIVVLMKPGLTLPSTPRGEVLEWSFPNPESWNADAVRPLREAVSEKIRETLLARSTTADTAAKPSVLFVCVHNAGRSQMAAGFLRDIAGDRIEVRSAGSIPADQINPIAVEAMGELGIDITTEAPKVLTTEAVQASDVVITMGCGDACPFFPGKRYEDWALDDPAGQGIDAVRPIRDDIRRRIEALAGELLA